MKLNKKMLTIKLKKVRKPDKMSLIEYIALYKGLIKKYGNKKTLRLGYLGGYYSQGAYYLYERRLETDAELAKRQAKEDKWEIRIKAERARIKKARMEHRAEARIEAARIEKARKKAMMEKKVEEVKVMVSILKAAGYSVSPKAVSKAI